MNEFEGKSTAREIEIDVPNDQSVEDESANRDLQAGEIENTSEKLQENDCLEQLRRLQAEFANYKKRVAKEQLYSKELGRSECISAILPVLDDFDRMSENHNDLTGDQAIEGIRLIRDNLIKIL